MCDKTWHSWLYYYIISCLVFFEYFFSLLSIVNTTSKAFVKKLSSLPTLMSTLAVNT